LAEKKYPFSTSKNIYKNAKTGYVETQDFENENLPTAATGLNVAGLIANKTILCTNDTVLTVMGSQTPTSS
jgi:hypothetical protein